LTEYASARPTKHFFYEMFTRDISLEDCVLDLIDNAIDSLVREKKIDVSSQILSRNGTLMEGSKLPSIAVSCTDTEMKIRDDCGGIPAEVAKKDLFSFGHPEGYQGGQLGAYGVGLKRALFKIGNSFEMTSFTNGAGFRAYLDNVKTWAAKDEKLEDWRIPVESLSRERSHPKGGTEIRIKELHEPVKARLRLGTFADELYKDVAQTYCLFLNRYVSVSVNDKLVQPRTFPLGESSEVQPAKSEFREDGVNVTLLASLAARPWTSENAGWYILCNGRVVVAAEKTELTGWVSPRIFHDKYRGFLGLAFFQSPDPLKLPWTTTKRNVNRESIVFQSAVNRMRDLGAPILRFLSDFYPPDADEPPQNRAVAERVRIVDVREVAAKGVTDFKLQPLRPYVPTTIRVQYDAPREDIDRVRKALRRPRMSASDIGKHTFSYFVRKECPK
jgi:Histidine kinase-, DNA gyrase B-, and HSP90-like ATPase